MHIHVYCVCICMCVCSSSKLKYVCLCECLCPHASVCGMQHVMPRVSLCLCECPGDVPVSTCSCVCVCARECMCLCGGVCVCDLGHVPCSWAASSQWGEVRPNGILVPGGHWHAQLSCGAPDRISLPLLLWKVHPDLSSTPASLTPGKSFLLLPRSSSLPQEA